MEAKEVAASYLAALANGESPFFKPKKQVKPTRKQ